MDEEAALDMIVLRGRIMQGFPPETPDQWALAETMFADDALTEIRRWSGLLEDDRADGRKPLDLVQHGGGEHCVPCGVEVDDDLVPDVWEEPPHETGLI